MKLSRDGLSVLLLTSVVEVRFKRRKSKAGWNDTRRMLCSNNTALLNSMPGQIALHFKKPTHPPPFNAKQHNLVTTWDILWQDYRNISTETHDVVAVMPTQTKEQVEAFWVYFADTLQRTSMAEKIAFMNDRKGHLIP